MTCIIGYNDRENQELYIAGDSLVSYGPDGNCFNMHQQKIFRIEIQSADGETHEFIIGCAGSPRYLQLIQYKFQPDPPRPGEGTGVEYMAGTFVDSLRKLLKDCDSERKGENDPLPIIDLWLLIGYRGEIYVMESNYTMIQWNQDYVVIGSGDMAAAGAMFATEEYAIPIHQRIDMALRAAEYFHTTVRGPFSIITLDYGEKREPTKIKTRRSSG